MKNAIVIGAGFSGLSCATYLAKNGYQVRIIEKHNMPGGRARVYQNKGFTFDMGPSWYWMPDVFERFFNDFGYSANDFYELKRLDPSYRIFYGKDDFLDVPAGKEKMIHLFESIEKGSGEKLHRFLEDAEYKYKVGVKDLIYKPALSVFEFAQWSIIKDAFRLQLLKSYHKYLRDIFKEARLYPMLEFPIIFLGATPKKTPALYSLMNYGDMELGTWYPMGGMFEVVKAMEKLAISLGVEIMYNVEAERIETSGNQAKVVWAGGKAYDTDLVVASADYHHVEQSLLPSGKRNYSEKYWNSRDMSPSSLIFYIGINKKLKHFEHHTLFFHEDFQKHAAAIFEQPKWPEKPLIYTSVTSKTDTSAAPEGMDNLMVLIPVASGLKDTPEIRDKYFNLVVHQLEQITGQSIRDHIVFHKSYAHNDFENDYHAYKGNAFGLGNTLLQTAFMKPKIVNKKISNLFYTGQLTTPGPGVPPAIVSGKVVADYIISKEKKFR